MIMQTMEEGDEPCKLFVGGLSWETTKESLYETFIKFGEIIDCLVMMNAETAKSRGFGFVTYKDAASVELVLTNKPHIVDGRQVDAKLCNKKAAAAARIANKINKVDNKDKKIFVGGLPLNVTEERCREFFSQYGVVTDVVIMYDTVKQRPRGFGFIGFESEETVGKMCELHFVSFDGKQVECKAAKPRIPGMGSSTENQNPNAWAVAAITQQYTNPSSFQQQQQQVQDQAAAYGYGQDPNVNSFGIDLSAYGYGYQAPQYAEPTAAAVPPAYNQQYAQAPYQPPPAGYPPAPQPPPAAPPAAGYPPQPAPGAYEYQNPAAAAPPPHNDYGNVGQGYGQQPSHYGPDRSQYGGAPPPQQQQYGGFQGGPGGANYQDGPGNYPNHNAGGPGPGAYHGDHGGPPSGGGGGGQQGYHPYRR